MKPETYTTEEPRGTRAEERRRPIKYYKVPHGPLGGHLIARTAKRWLKPIERSMRSKYAHLAIRPECGIAA